MLKITINLLLLTLFMSTAAFAKGDPTTTAAKSTSKIMQTLNVIQPNPGVGTFGATWTATGNGPFLVTIGDITTGVLVEQFVTNVKFFVRNNYTLNHTYLVSVGDVTVISKQITLN